MKVFINLFYIFLMITAFPLRAATNTFIDYQNYNHGYCPECNCFPCKCKAADVNEEPPPVPCATCPNGNAPPPEPVPKAPPASPCKKPDPCTPATVCGTNCGISLCWIGLAIAVIATAAAIIVSSNNGSDPSH